MPMPIDPMILQIKTSVISAEKYHKCPDKLDLVPCRTPLICNTDASHERNSLSEEQSISMSKSKMTCQCAIPAFTKFRIRFCAKRRIRTWNTILVLILSFSSPAFYFN